MTVAWKLKSHDAVDGRLTVMSTALFAIGYIIDNVVISQGSPGILHGHWWCTWAAFVICRLVLLICTQTATCIFSIVAQYEAIAKSTNNTPLVLWAARARTVVHLTGVV